MIALFAALAAAHDVTVTVQDAWWRTGIPFADLQTPCGCHAQVDGFGSWTGSAVPGPSGAIELVPGTKVDLTVSAYGYLPRTKTLHVRERRDAYTVRLTPEPVPRVPRRDRVAEDDDFYWVCGGVIDDYAYEEPVNVFTPEPPGATPPPATGEANGWNCPQPPTPAP